MACAAARAVARARVTASGSVGPVSKPWLAQLELLGGTVRGRRDGGGQPRLRFGAGLVRRKGVRGRLTPSLIPNHELAKLWKREWKRALSRVFLTRTSPVLHGGAESRSDGCQKSRAASLVRAGFEFVLPSLTVFLSWTSGKHRRQQSKASAPASNQCRGSPAIAPQAALPGVHPCIAARRAASMAAQDELTLLAGELARKIEGTKVNEVFARGVPGITHETFTSEAAVRALMTCERLFEVDEEEKSPQRRKRVSLLPNKLLRRHSLDFRRALDAWDQLVARGYVLHVDPGHLSLDGERELKNKDAVNNSTHFRFEPSRFAPFALRCAVLAVRGLPPSTTASCVVTVGSQTSDFFS